MADDFAVTGPGWSVQSLSFFSYQSFAGSAYTFSSVNWSLISGDVNSGAVVASGTGTPAANRGLQGYRVSATTLTNTDRAIFRLNVDVPDFSLANAAFASVVDAGDGLGVEFPFIIAGTVVPEPSTWAPMIAGGLAVVGAARRRQQR